jgi:hypothetical protein
MYRRADCCNNVAIMAHVRLIAKLKNQSEFTQMADLDGEKSTDGVDERVALGSAST